MSETKSLAERIRLVDSLPSPPTIAIQILQICQNPEASIQELAEVLSLDAALAAQILRISNSAAYSRGREITRLSEAVILLGARNVSIIALGFRLKEAMPEWEHKSGMTDARLWQHNVATAVTARGLARLARVSDTETAFLCGLLSRIGQLLLYTIDPDAYGNVLEATDGQLPSAEMESELLGSSHHEAADLLLKKWGLPTVICDAVRCWDGGFDYDQLPPESQRMANIIKISDTFARMMFAEQKAFGLQRVHHLAQRDFGLSGGEVERMFRSCGQDLEQCMAIFDVPVQHEIDCSAILETARQQLVNLSLGLAADLDQARTNTTDLMEQNRQLAKESSTDALTGLYNRKALNAELVALDEARGQSNGYPPYSVLMIDVDHFKRINDTYGHTVGDELLRAVADTLSRSARATDVVARYGGEEFVVVLTNAGQNEAAQVAERFRRAVESHKLPYQDGYLCVTASIGVAYSDALPLTSSFQEVLDAADAALYEAKRAGRNRIALADQTNCLEGHIESAAPLALEFSSSATSNNSASDS